MREHRIQPSGLATSRQRGAIGILLVSCISVMLAMLAISDFGFMYITKREFQKAADLAAMAGARRLVAPGGTPSCADATTAATTNAQTNLSQSAIPPFDTLDITISCGNWDTSDSNGPFVASNTMLNAVHTVVEGKPYGFFLPVLFGRDPEPIQAHATAFLQSPLAQLKIRSKLLSLHKGVINSLFSSLLGGEAGINLDLVSWEGIANTDISLLKLLAPLKLLADVGTYQELLQEKVSLGEILDSMIAVVEPSSTAALALELLKTQTITVDHLNIPLGDLLNLQTGTGTTALDTMVNAFDLLRAAVEVANGKNAIALSNAIDIPGFTGVSVQAKVIEPPQTSMIGNPELIDPGNPMTSPNNLYVRTGQVRALISVDLALLPGLLDGVLGTLNSIGVVKVLDSELHIALEVGGAEGWVTDYSCTNGSKRLNATAKATAAEVGIGHLTEKQKLDLFSANTLFPKVQPLNLLKVSLLLNVADATLGATSTVLGDGPKALPLYSATPDAPDGLPEVLSPDTVAMYKTLPNQDLLGSFNNTVAGLKLKLKLLGILNLDTLLNNASDLIVMTLTPLLDPVLNSLLDTLGLNLAEADLGAKLSCNGSAVLVD